VAVVDRDEDGGAGASWLLVIAVEFATRLTSQRNASRISMICGAGIPMTTAAIRTAWITADTIQPWTHADR
jgi:hypothetical protein